MSYEVDLVEVQPVSIAIVRRRGTLAQVGELVMPALDLVWESVGSEGLNTGQDVIVYRMTDTDAFDMEIGVEIEEDEVDLPPGEVELSQIPGGRVAHTVHTGPYDRLSEAFAAIWDWARAQDVQLQGVWWEVYGEWSEDPEQLSTDCYSLLA